jgi:hypothetical protein
MQFLLFYYLFIFEIGDTDSARAIEENTCDQNLSPYCQRLGEDEEYDEEMMEYAQSK